MYIQEFILLKYYTVQLLIKKKYIGKRVVFLKKISIYVPSYYDMHDHALPLYGFSDRPSHSKHGPKASVFA